MPLPLPFPLPQPSEKPLIPAFWVGLIPTEFVGAGAGAAVEGSTVVGVTVGGAIAVFMVKSSACALIVVIAFNEFVGVLGAVTVNVVSFGCVVCVGGAVIASVLSTNPPSPPTKSGGSEIALNNTVVPKIATKTMCNINEIVKNRDWLNLSMIF